MREVRIDPVPLARLSRLLGAEQTARLEAAAVRARRLLAGRVVWNVNATAAGGGVAEMLQGLLAYGRGAGVDTRWLVLDGSPAFFRVTKRLHNRLHGSAGDGGPLGPREREVYEHALDEELTTLAGVVRPGDVVLLHDPQTAGLAAGLRARGAHVVWRCHIGRDEPDELSTSGWEFLRPHLDAAEVTVFSRRSYAPPWLSEPRVLVIAPSLDPFSTKNRPLADDVVARTLARAGLVAGPTSGEVTFPRRNGSRGRVRVRHDQLLTDGWVPAGARVVLQVSRWDGLKDMAGVLTAFAEHLDLLPPDAHLVLAGPETAGVHDDPEGAQVLDQCLGLWRGLPAATRARTHLAALAMADVDENAHVVNALQRHAAVVVQKSIAEGFGLTVTEPMWKARPVVASRVGGIVDQVVDGQSGLLLDDPQDLAGFADLVGGLLGDPARAARLGTAARERVRHHFLGDRHLEQYVDLFGRLVP